MKSRHLLLLSILYALYSMAAQTPTKFSADKAQCHQKKTDMICVYSGNAEFTQETNTLAAPTITTYQNAQHELYQIIAEGAPARYRTQDQTKTMNAIAQTIKLYPPKNLALFIKDAEITQNGSQFRGQYLEYDMNKKTILSKPKNKSSTTIIIPQS